MLGYGEQIDWSQSHRRVKYKANNLKGNHSFIENKKSITRKHIVISLKPKMNFKIRKIAANEIKLQLLAKQLKNYVNEGRRGKDRKNLQRKIPQEERSRISNLNLSGSNTRRVTSPKKLESYHTCLR